MSNDDANAGGGRLWKAILGCVALALAVGLCGWLLGAAQSQASLEQTRQALRQAGFKTELSDFDFATKSEFNPPAAVVARWRFDRGFGLSPTLLPVIGTNAGMVGWRQPWLPTSFGVANWVELQDYLGRDEAQLDEVCQAILAEPLRFDLAARDVGHVYLQHLPQLWALSRVLGDRELLDLHQGNLDRAWTNLLTATRLVTAWQVQPAEADVQPRWRFLLVFNTLQTTWQALQTNGWSDEQLARLQQEWAGVDFFTNLPETVAYGRVKLSYLCREWRRNGAFENTSKFSVEDWFNEASARPVTAWKDLRKQGDEYLYRSYALNADEKAILLYSRQCELAVRHAVTNPTWSAMSRVPGVNNPAVLPSSNPENMRLLLMALGYGSAYQANWGLLECAVESEALRRIILTALALERHRARHGAYPANLTSLAPEFLPAPPLDFMDGQPLRYQRTADGHFLLYSIGLDGVDNGGNLLTFPDLPAAPRGGSPAVGMAAYMVLPGGDLVWPRPATAQEVDTAERARQAAAAASSTKRPP